MLIKIYIQVTSYRLRRLHLGIYMYIYYIKLIHAHTYIYYIHIYEINEKEVMNLEESREVYIREF